MGLYKSTAISLFASSDTGGSDCGTGIKSSRLRRCGRLAINGPNREEFSKISNSGTAIRLNPFAIEKEARKQIGKYQTSRETDTMLRELYCNYSNLFPGSAYVRRTIGILDQGKR